jgi:hypothetical protein
MASESGEPLDHSRASAVRGGWHLPCWIDFFIKESIARSLYVPYHVYADLWEKSLSRLDGLMAMEAALLQGNKEGHLVTGQSTQFPRDEQIAIHLTLGGARDPEDPVKVFVNGVEATPIGADDYTIDARSLSPEPGATLSIVLR